VGSPANPFSSILLNTYSAFHGECLREDLPVGVLSGDIIEQDLEVHGVNPLEVLNGALSSVLAVDGKPLEGTDGGVHTGPVHGVTDGTGVGEVRKVHADGDVVLEGLVRLRCVPGAKRAREEWLVIGLAQRVPNEDEVKQSSLRSSCPHLGVNLVLEVPGHDLRNVHEFINLVVGEVDVVSDTGLHTRNVREELVHSVFVAGNGNDEVVLVVLHDVEENLDGLLSVVPVVGRVVEVVGLIDEEDSSESLLDHLLGLGGGVADVLSDEIVTGGNHDVSGTSVTHLGEDLCDERSDE